MLNKKKQINIRKIKLKDLESFKKWNHPDRLFHKYNGPYFKIPNEKELDDIIKNMKNLFRAGDEDVLTFRRMLDLLMDYTMIRQVMGLLKMIGRDLEDNVGINTIIIKMWMIRQTKNYIL